jgi:hypothetical protein
MLCIWMQSSSFADFWARRWNLTTTYMLRVLIYEPVMEGQPAAPLHTARARYFTLNIAAQSWYYVGHEMCERVQGAEDLVIVAVTAAHRWQAG